NKVFLAQRPNDADRWAGMWEFPRGELCADETHEVAARRLLSHLTGLRAKLGPELVTVRHGVTRYRITLTALEATYTQGTFASPFYSRGLWLTAAALSEYPVGTAQRRLADAVTKLGRQR